MLNTSTMKNVALLKNGTAAAAKTQGYIQSQYIFPRIHIHFLYCDVIRRAISLTKRGIPDRMQLTLARRQLCMSTVLYSKSTYLFLYSFTPVTYDIQNSEEFIFYTLVHANSVKVATRM
jgi:hypothetical protein